MVNKYLKKVDEKTVLFAVFILLAILALGSLLVINKPKLTGHVTEMGEYGNKESCEAVEGQIWYEEVCYDGQPICASDFLELCEDEIACTGVNGVWEDVVVGQENCLIDSCIVCKTDCLNLCVEGCEDNDPVDCVEGCVPSVDLCVEGCEADCTCVEGDENCVCDDVIEKQCVECILKTCADYSGQCGSALDDNCGSTIDCSNNCDSGYSCVEGICECVPDTCDSLSYACGSPDDGCGVTLDCGTCDSGYSCDEGECVEDTTSNGDSSADMTGATIDGMKKSSCVSNWECSEWTPCTAGMQTRECTDSNNCVTPTDEPAVSLSCVGSPKTETPKTSETCSDGIRNQDEKGIDCGGVCEQRCSFFTIMGNVVNVPVNSSKQFIKNNKAISFSILGLIVLAVGWIVCVKVFLKKKNIFFFLENFDFSKCLAFFKGKKTD